MSLNRSDAGGCVALLLASLAAEPTAAATVCPSRPEQTVRFVDVFDGPSEEMASLVPDEAGDHKGSWQLGYVYDAGRFVTVQCKYADGQVLERRLTKRVARCDYKIDKKKTLALDCR